MIIIITLHFHDIILFQDTFIASEWGEMANSVVDRDTSWESNASFDLLLRVFIHVPSLPIHA